MRLWTLRKYLMQGSIAVCIVEVYIEVRVLGKKLGNFTMLAKSSICQQLVFRRLIATTTMLVMLVFATFGHSVQSRHLCSSMWESVCPSADTDSGDCLRVPSIPPGIVVSFSYGRRTYERRQVNGEWCVVTSSQSDNT